MFADWAVLDAERSYGKHEGLDFAGKTGDPVLACLGGRVAKVVRKSTGYGNHVVLEHSDGWYTWYAHLSEITVALHDPVSRGQKIGEVGSTGNSTGPHLHLTVQHIGNGMSGYWLPDIVDPRPLF